MTHLLFSILMVFGGVSEAAEYAAPATKTKSTEAAPARGGVAGSTAAVEKPAPLKDTQSGAAQKAASPASPPTSGTPPPRAAKESLAAASAPSKAPPANKTNVKEQKEPPRELTFWERIQGKKFGVGVDARLNYVPRLFLSLFMEASHTVISPVASIRGIMRGRRVDFIVKGSYWDVRPQDGVWLAKGYKWVEADYIKFDPVRFYFIEVALLWNLPLADSLYLTWGGGVGGGWLNGTMKTTGAQGCRGGNYDNVTTSTSYLGSHYCYRDTNEEFWSKEKFPSLMGMIQGTVGLRYDVTEHITIKAEAGLFLPGFLHASLAIEYLF